MTRAQVTSPAALRVALVAGSLAACLAGCAPNFYAVSTPPPTRTARLDSHKPFFGARQFKATVSQGVALAIVCEQGGPCRDARATTDDPAVAQVVPAHLNRLHYDAFADATTPASSFVIYGVAPGQTTIRVKSADGDRDIAVTVVE